MKWNKTDERIEKKLSRENVQRGTRINCTHHKNEAKVVMYTGNID